MQQKEPSKKRQQTAKKIIKAIEGSHGLLTIAAQKCGLNRSTVWRYVQDYPSVKKAVEEAQEVMLDFAESKLYKKIDDGDMTAIIFYLKTRGKHRGYVERQEIEIPSEIKVNVNYVKRKV